MGNLKHILYPVGTLVRFRKYPASQGYITKVFIYGPISYTFKYFSDGSEINVLQEQIEFIPSEHLEVDNVQDR